MDRLPALALTILLGCAPRPPAGDSIAPPGAASAEVTGVVRVVGSAPVNVQTVLETPSGAVVRLVGDLEPELRRLSGAEVSVQGDVSAAPDPVVDRQLQAASYEIVAVDGMPVTVGEVISVEGGVVKLRTVSGQEVTLDGAPASFQVGQKVWVQGPTRVTVQVYGTLRP